MGAVVPLTNADLDLQNPETRERLRWAREKAKCEADFLYLAGTYLRLKSKSTIGFPTLKLNRVQQFIHDTAQDQLKRVGWIRKVYGKARQIGSSTFWRAKSFHETAFKSHRNAFVANYDEPNSYEIFDIDKTFYANLPKPLQPSLESGAMAKNRMVFRGRNSKCLVGHARNLNVGASQMNHFVHLTEVARYEHAEQIQASLFPSISEARDLNGQDYSGIVIESTSRYGGWWFKDFYEAALRGEMPGWEAHFIPWYWHQDYQRPVPKGFHLTAAERDLKRKYKLTDESIVWWREKRAEYRTHPALFIQEYPFDWESSWQLPAGTLRVFDDDLLEQLSQTVQPGRRATQTSAGFVYELGAPTEVWEEPQPGVFYDIGVDVSGGRTEDAAWTVAVVVRRDTLAQVAQYRVQIDPTSPELIDSVYWLGMNYNSAQVNIDITGGWGLALQYDLQRRSYPNFWRWRRRDDAKERVSSRQGFIYTRQDRMSLVSNAVGLSARGQVVVRSELLLDEMRNYLNIAPEEYGSAPGCHNDIVNAWMLALLAARDERQEWSRPQTETKEVERPPAHLVHDVDADLAAPEPGLIVSPWGFR